MNALAELLELLYSARDRLNTFQATVYRWSDVLLAREASDWWEKVQRSKAGRFSWGADDGPGPLPPVDPIHERTDRLWFEPPSAWRYEADPKEDFGGSLPTVQTYDGHASWRYYPRRGVWRQVHPIRDDGRDIADNPALHSMLDPSVLIPEVRFEGIERTLVAGRKAIVVSGRLDESIDGSNFELPWHVAEQCEWAVDAELGILLRSRHYLEGKLYSNIEMQNVVFDEPLSDDLFSIPQSYGY